MFLNMQFIKFIYKKFNNIKLNKNLIKLNKKKYGKLLKKQKTLKIYYIY